MNKLCYQTIEELLVDLEQYEGIHIECSKEASEKILAVVRQLEKQYTIGYVTSTDKGYERESIKSYLHFWKKLHGCKEELNTTLENFSLKNKANKKLCMLSPGEQALTQMARMSMQKARLYFVEEPLLNLSGEEMSKILAWMSRCQADGIRFITTNASMRHILLMPGNAFYYKDEKLYEIEENESGTEFVEEEDIRILKIPAKSGNSTLLFEPSDIDFIESFHKSNYISVRGTLFQVTQNMDELEGLLCKSGFFRCHRSYIVNMQKVEQIEKLSKNSYTLLLNNTENSSIPLSKGRVENMKATFGW